MQMEWNCNQKQIIFLPCCNRFLRLNVNVKSVQRARSDCNPIIRHNCGTINYLDGWTIDRWVNLSTLNWCAQCTHSEFAVLVIYYTHRINKFINLLETELKRIIWVFFFLSLPLARFLPSIFHPLRENPRKFIGSNKSSRSIKNFDILWFDHGKIQNYSTVKRSLCHLL